MEEREELSTKNKTSKFKQAIKEIESDIQERNNVDSNETFTGPITLKDVPIDELIATFKDHEEKLRVIFSERRQKSDHLNRGNGFDYLTVLWRTVEIEQQQHMYKYVRDDFTNNYFENPNVR